MLKEIGWEPEEVHDFARKWATSQTQYIGWIHVWDEDVTLRIWAFRETKKYHFEIREVVRASTDETENIIIRDMYMNPMCGWRVVYRPSEAKCSSWYGYTYYSYAEEDFNVWEVNNKVPGVQYKILNLEALQTDFFKYCGYKDGDIIEYLKLWKKHPCTEYFGKVGMKPSKAIIKQIEKDKAFGRWIAKQNIKDMKYAGSQAILFAYRNNMTILEAKDVCLIRNNTNSRFRGCENIRDSGLNYIRVAEYLDENGIGKYNYDDYIEAVMGLGLDLNDTKNSFPKDFKRMHDLRIAEYTSHKNKRKNTEFKKAAKQYIQYEYSEKSYCIVIPRKITDLVNEGDKLHHCVGRMGYDSKMIQGRSFIAFLRKSDDVKTPYVTIEYSLKDNKILQIYGDQDSKPSKEVIKFANKWEKRIKNEIKHNNTVL